MNNLINFDQKRHERHLSNINKERSFSNYLRDLKKELEELKSLGEIDDYSIRAVDNNRIEVLIDT